MSTPNSIREDVLGDFLLRADAQPVLVDVGASGAAYGAWSGFAHRSVFVGFDPDQREMNPDAGKGYAAYHIIPKIVDGPNTTGRAPFYLTEYPYCSSLLEPDHVALAPYIFADLFKVEREVELETTTLAAAMDALNLPAIDWLKIDTQGRDLSVIMGLDEKRRDRLLCIDVEPGFSPFYKDEESFCQIHAALTARGFWLAHLKCQHYPRVRATTVKAAFGIDLKATDPAVRLFGPSPTAAEARYLPSLEHLRRRNAPFRDYAISWTFAVSTGLWGHALELAAAAKTIPGADEPRVKILAQFMFDSIRQTVSGLAGSGARA